MSVARSAPELPGDRELQVARQRLAGQVRRTPVLELGNELHVSGRVLLKLELLQHTGAFKARGALNALLAHPSTDAGVVAASGGNHGAALAWAAARTGLRASIFVPASSPQAKKERIRGYGGELTVVDGYYADALEASTAHMERTGARSVHAYDEPAVVAGQSTIGAELLEQVPDVDTILVASGGGGLYAGTALACVDRARVLPVEPQNAQALYAAVAAGEPVPVEVGGVAVDSLGARKAGIIATTVARRQGATPVLVSDDAIVTAQRWLWEHARIVVEPGAATPMAALVAGAYEPAPEEAVAVVLSGGNTASSPFG